jgi:hypothetical protein
MKGYLNGMKEDLNGIVEEARENRKGDRTE